MALIDRVPGDLDLYIGGYVMAAPRVEILDIIFSATINLRLMSSM